MNIEADFPGGNILVDSVQGDTVCLRQDRRTTTEWWFYWRFRVRGAAGRTIRFQFTDGDVFGVRGPCVCTDGADWRWLGRECVDGTAFTYAFAENEDRADFAFCIPYVEADLRTFLTWHPDVRQNVLTTSERGRAVEHLTLSSRLGSFVVPITARLHACETMGSFVLEGILAFWREDSPESRFLQEHVDLQIIPFFDKDGVEEGDQGKLRAPHDHNRDFGPTPRYAATRAWMALLNAWREKMIVAFDIHCPWIRGGRNEEIFLVGSPEPWQARQERFAALLEQGQAGELTYHAQNNIPYGAEWNTGEGNTFTRFVRDNYPVAFAGAVEFPYAAAGGQTVTADGARAFGRDLARALSQYVQEHSGLC